MSLANLEKAFQLIENNFTEEDMSTYGGCSLKTIEKAEIFLNIKFPKTYRIFLERYKCDEINTFGIYGLTKEESFEDQEIPFYSTPNVVWTVLQYHRDFKHPLHLLIIYDLGEGTKYCLDLSQMNDDECPVVVWPIWGYENNPKLEILAQDFGNFLLEMVEERIKWK